MSTMTTPPATDIAAAVCNARAELSTVIRSLTQVLEAVAEGEIVENPKDWTEPDLAKKERENLLKRRSLEPVLARFDTLKKAVELATSLHAARVAKMKEEEGRVSEEDRGRLVDRRAQLVEEVGVKNRKIKILIDHLRELHRDIVALLACYPKPFNAQNRRAQG